MATWRPFKGMFLDELLRLEGLANDLRSPHCAHCHIALNPTTPSSPRLFRCDDCGQHLQCLACCLAQHSRSPLHRLEEWNGSFWTAASLVELGLVYQVGHGGFPCALPDTTIHNMVVLDAPYIHTVRLRYCNCGRAQEADPVAQLLRNAWYPATVLDPSTCATFRTLRAFRLYNVLGNLNVTDFIAALERMTNTMAVSGLTSVPDRGRQFQRMARQWAFLTRLKRVGRGHDPAGVEATALGQCAVECWACPHDGKNLPLDWRSVDPRLRFLHMLILAVDANFRLKNRICANEINDGSLGPGWAYWVEPEGYQEHVRKYVKEDDMTSCIAFAALLQKDTRMTTGLRVSGVGGCVCARHECMRPNGLGDLQKGERYCNIDWIVFSAIMGVVILALTISYDIACQWKVRLPERVSRLPESMRRNLEEMRVQYGLPIWHSNSHIVECANENKLQHQPGVGKADGEGVERLWANLNPAALATKEMGLGNRADTLDDRLDNHNFLKNMRQGATLQRRLLVARVERENQVAAFRIVSDSVDAALQKKWKAQVKAWEEDKSQPNPYVLPTTGFPTEAEIRLELQQEERQNNVDGRASIAGSSATSFISAGIQIEDTQYRLRELRDEQTLLTADREAKLE
ncbi:CxC2 domain-containing protein [Mycena kentingensis (nom. inval.)]|nr:CxC2 domain-containing protein [Mycena kentingensis (nom. inval.)]